MRDLEVRRRATLDSAVAASRITSGELQRNG